jgi:SAM-dependent methyltransferase
MRYLLQAIVFCNNKAKRLAIRLTKWTGKSPTYIHPKHLLPDEDYWYIHQLPKIADVLDVGCGTGAHTRRAARYCRNVVGVDKDVKLSVTGNTAFLKMDLEKGIDIDSTFDVVMCLDVLEHIHNRHQLLCGMRLSLKRYGYMILSVPKIDTSWKKRLQRAGLPYYSDRDHKIEYRLRGLQEELNAAGFGIAELYSSVYDTPLVGLIDIVGGFSLTAYRWLTKLRKKLARKYYEENAGFYVICERLY